MNGSRMRLSIVVLGAAVAFAPASLGQAVSTGSPPGELVKTGMLLGSVAKAVRTDLKRSWYDWQTLERKVIVTRRERQDAGEPFVQQVQEVSVPYFVTDVKWRCEGADEIKTLFVAGRYEDGDSVIERWAFIYPPTIDDAGQYVPLDARPLPEIAKRRIYRGDSLGHIKSLAPDPLGRYLLFLTHENPTLYRISSPGNAITVELDQSEVPYLAHAGFLAITRHATEGLQVRILVGSSWHVDLTQETSVIILRDGDDDGVFDAPEVVSDAQWAAYGYDDHTVWLPVCANGTTSS